MLKIALPKKTLKKSTAAKTKELLDNLNNLMGQKKSTAHLHSSLVKQKASIHLSAKNKSKNLLTSRTLGFQNYINGANKPEPTKSIEKPYENK